MKIVQVMATSGGGIGGLEKHTFDLCKSLTDLMEVHLILDRKYAEQKNILPQVQCHYVDFSRNRWSIGLLFKIYGIIRKIHPDIIHAQGGKASGIVSFLSVFFQIPTVATVHGMKNHVRDYLSFTQVIAVSSKAAEKIKAHRMVHIIYNGIAEDTFIRSQESYISDKLKPQKALAIGRLDAVKGFDLLIRAWKGIDLQLEIWGEGKEHEYLQGLIEHEQLQNKIKLMGFSDNILQHLSSCDFVIVSSLKEGGPLVVAEALLQHKPVIATDVGMVRDFIPEKYITKTNDADALHQLIQLTIRGSDDLSHDFRESFVKAERNLTLKAMSENTFRVYKECFQRV
ncbi:glycosyltransferase [Acinetobacter sp. WZC-1]|uniref:glycosyltransferase n=1 Tax=Acinetobacter sp. WZC-1 TaxID=3459034 RepID=UPI00403D68AA